ncbi:helix-turn-helix transcriptional regulator [Catellatospora sp. NPDC049609]|uniref:helix-turn-helix domain-containing protein n=1 Tax=Catellatospora sp. NPDC049609 TaxID=3155505 RepID=UPI0034168400
MALRRSREAREFTQGQVAEALDWSLSKVQRIESGEVTVSGTDLRALLAYLDVTEPGTVEQLARDARASRRRGWWDQPGYRAHLTPATMQLLQFESQAVAIRCFSSTMVPGVLQTRRHADAVFAFWNREISELSDEQRDTRLEVRMRRHEQVFGREEPPAYLLLLDESVLHREVGGPEVMAEQLQQLLENVTAGRVTLRIVPFSRAAVVAMLGAFVLLDLDVEGDTVLYRESWLRDEMVHASEAVNRHRWMFDEMWRHSYTEEKSVLLLEARIATLRASLER